MIRTVFLFGIVLWLSTLLLLALHREYFDTSTDDDVAVLSSVTDVLFRGDNCLRDARHYACARGRGGGERFVTYGVGGGFNNQRASLERAWHVAWLLNRTLIVRPIRVDVKMKQKKKKNLKNFF